MDEFGPSTNTRLRLAVTVSTISAETSYKGIAPAGSNDIRIRGNERIPQVHVT